VLDTSLAKVLAARGAVLLAQSQEHPRTDVQVVLAALLAWDGVVQEFVVRLVKRGADTMGPSYHPGCALPRALEDYLRACAYYNVAAA